MEGAENRGGNVAEFRGAAEKRPDMGKPRMACQGAWALPSRQWMSHWKTLNREMTVISGFWCLKFGFLAWGESPLPSTARSGAERQSNRVVKWTDAEVRRPGLESQM